MSLDQTKQQIHSKIAETNNILSNLIGIIDDITCDGTTSPPSSWIKPNIIYPTNGSTVPLTAISALEETVTSWGGKKIPTRYINSSSDDYLIKPTSDSNSGIVILLPWFYWDAITKASIHKGTQELLLVDTSKDSGNEPYANGARVHLRNNTDGSLIKQATLTVILKDGKTASYSTDFSIRHNNNWSLNFGEIPNPEPNPNPGIGIVSVRWNGPDNKTFNVRANNLTNSSLRMSGNNCGNVPHYMCRDGHPNKTFNLEVVPGHSYKFWAHITGRNEWDEVTFNVEQGDIPPTPPPTGKMKAAMLTDKACDTRSSVVTQTAKDVANGNRYNTISTLVDLQEENRNYVSWGRKDNKLTSLALNNINTLRIVGNRIVLMTRNDWAIKHKYYTDGNLGQWEDKAYNSAFLSREKEFLSHVVSTVNPDGIQLCLEPPWNHAVDFYLSCAQHLRNIGYNKDVYVNVIGEAQNRLKQLGSQFRAASVQSACTCTDLVNFCGWDVMNTDGDPITENQYSSVYNHINGSGKPFIIWTPFFVKGNIPPGVF